MTLSLSIDAAFSRAGIRDDMRCRDSPGPRTVNRRPYKPEIRQDSPILDEAWLRVRYVDERMTYAQIARLARCSFSTIHTMLVRFGIPARPARCPRRCER